jgi:hypothetical protein
MNGKVEVDHSGEKHVCEGVDPYHQSACCSTAVRRKRGFTERGKQDEKLGNKLDPFILLIAS